MEGTIGEIRLFAGNFAPRSWAFCEGQLLSIAQNTALFSILGTTYGGNGQTTFALPDLRGRAPVHPGNGPGLSPRTLGQATGSEQVTLTGAQLPAHNHALAVSDQDNDAKLPSGGFLTAGNHYHSAANGQAPASTISSAGGNQPVSIVQPILALNYIICLQGIFPSRS